MLEDMIEGVFGANLNNQRQLGMEVEREINQI